jgi:hypothetical protein
MLMGAATTTTALAEALKRLAGEKAKLGRVWPHMLRHSGGYYLVSQAHGRVAGHRFEGLWK